MCEKVVLYFLLLTKVIDLTMSVYEDGSTVILRPSTNLQQPEFGFSIAYQPGVKRLLIGAPRADLLGKVFSCAVININVDTIKCNEDVISIENDTTVSREKNPNQSFYLGASIAATSQYYITCAPLWTASVIPSKVPKSKKKEENVHGTCFFVYTNGTTSRYRGTLEKYMNTGNRPYDFTYIGGTGWSSLIDEKNDLLLVAKTSLIEDLTYTHQSSPDNFLSHISQQLEIIKRNRLYRQAPEAQRRLMENGIWRYWNVGFALVAGNFFSNETVYAFSMLAHTMKGAIGFFRYDTKANMLTIITEEGKDWTKPYTIRETSKSVTSMFGVALGTGDLNLDGLAELLVGAPGHSYQDCVECGALHIYMGDTMELMQDKTRLRTIISDLEHSRFGTSILARDLNGDSRAEVIVSAPYENNGRGAIYVIDGRELYHTLMIEMSYKEVRVSDIRYTRRLGAEAEWRLGFSMRSVPDADGNGCDELAAGAPGENSVILYRCLNTINITISIRMIEDKITLEHTSFTVEVCANINFQKESSSVTGVLIISNSIFGQGVHIITDSDTTTTYSLSTDRKDYCSNIAVEMTDHEPENYKFSATAALKKDSMLRTNIVINPHNILHTSLNISRHCEGDCTPQLYMNLTWSGQDPYTLGSSSVERILLQVWNEGGTAYYGSCVKLSLTGTKVARVNGCEREIGETNRWSCALPKSMKKNNLVFIDFSLDMTKVTNADKELNIATMLLGKCNQDNVLTDKKNTTIVQYVINTDGVFIYGSTNDIHVSSVDLKDSSHPTETVQEYSITNNGNITWKNIAAEINIRNEPFFEATKVSFVPLSTNSCERSAENSSEIKNIVYQCKLDLQPNMTLKIVTTQFITKKDIGKYLPEDEASNTTLLNVTSQLKLYLTPTNAVRETSVNTTIVYHKETQRLKTWQIILIGVAVAIFLLAIMAFIMYKVGFFKRKQKERLKSLRESVRRRSSRRYLSTVSAPENSGNQDGLYGMDIGADSVFDDTPTTQDEAKKKPQRTRKKVD